MGISKKEMKQLHDLMQCSAQAYPYLREEMHHLRI
jgi:hypothetical protein